MYILISPRPILLQYNEFSIQGTMGCSPINLPILCVYLYMVWLLETYLSLHCKHNNKQHIVAACCSHIQIELQASFIYMLTTEYISSIYIHACLLPNNTCLQFNLLPGAVQTNISYKIPTKTQEDPNRAPGQAPTNSPAKPSPGWGKCSGPTWRWGNPDMVQKNGSGSNDCLVQKKTT